MPLKWYNIGKAYVSFFPSDWSFCSAGHGLQPAYGNRTGFPPAFSTANKYNSACTHSITDCGTDRFA